jgi:hypothetical protein
MSRTRDENEKLPRFDDETKLTARRQGLEDLMRRLEELTAENNKLRRKAKGKKTKGGSSSSEDKDSSLEEDVSKRGKKGRNNQDKPSYNLMSLTYDNIPSTTIYTSIPVGKVPYFNGTCYNQ